MGKWFLAGLTALLCAAAMMHAMMTRSLGLSLVCMASNSTTTGGNDSSCSAKKFDWDLLIQGQIIAMHDWGELVLLPVSGLLISMFDPALILFLASAAAVISNILFPVATLYLGFAGAMLTRFLLGVSHAFSSPSVDATVSKWTPRSCRSTLYSIITCGSQLSLIVGNPLIALLCGTCLLGGWPAIFYLISVPSVGWLLVFCSVYLLRLRPSRTNGEDNHLLNHVEQRVKWSYVCRSVFHELIRRPAFWALLPCSMSATCTIRLFTFYIPSYYSDVLKLSLLDNAVYTSLPFVMLIVGKIFFSCLSDLIVRHDLITRNISSKLFNCVSFLGSGACILVIGLTTTLPKQAIIGVLTFGLALHSASTPGYLTSVVSMNKKWTGVISAVCTFTAMVSGILLPVLVSSIVVHRIASEWRIVFCFIAGLDAFAATVYALFGYTEDPETPISTSEETKT